MRILIHMGFPYAMTYACAKRIKIFKEELEEQGHEVIILVPGDKKDKKIKGIIHCPTPPLKKKTGFYRLINGLGFAFSSIFKSFCVGKIDAVLTTSPPPLISMAGWLIAKNKRAKLVYDVRDIWPDVAVEMGSFSEESLYFKVFSFIRDFMLKHSDMVTTVSAGKVEKLKIHGLNQNIVQISNGLDKSFLENEINKTLYKKLQTIKEYKCVYIGNLGLAQGLGQLLAIAEKVKEEELNVRFLLYGTGAEEQKLKQYVLEKKLTNVSFEGELPNEDMYTILKVADLSFISLVNGNLKDSIPTKMYESLGAGCPVLLSAEGDSVDILNESGLGIAVKPNHPEELWRAFLALYENEMGIEQYKNQAVELMKEKYSRQRAAKELVRELELLFEEKIGYRGKEQCQK